MRYNKLDTKNKITEVFLMNIISQFHQFLENSFHSFLEKYFLESNFWHKSSDFNNYINFITDLDSFSYSFMINAIKVYFEHMDEVFFHTSYRKSFCNYYDFIWRSYF